MDANVYQDQANWNDQPLRSETLYDEMGRDMQAILTISVIAAHFRLHCRSR